MRTFSPTPVDIDPQWHVIDADGMVLGRLATQVATLLRGKHKPTFAPHMDMGDFVIVLNASKIVLTGNKGRDKWIWTHSGYPGGIKGQPIGEQLLSHPERVVENAVKGMLPKNTIGRKQLRKMKVYRGAEHPHSAQSPQPFAVK